LGEDIKLTAGRKINSPAKHWGTPKIYVDAVKEVFLGKIDLDPCSNEYSIVDAEVEYALPKLNGLEKSWDYPTIYVNPPYGLDKENSTRIDHWLVKCVEAYEKYRSEVLALIPVATNTGHWKRNVFGKAEAVCFLKDTRLRFLIRGKDIGKGAPMACAMVYWGRNYERFYDVFKKHGAVVNITDLKNTTINPRSESVHKLEKYV